MIKTDESALICDLAETYHIYNYRSLPLKMVATFSVGLRENSRIKMALADIKYSFETILLASILDGVNMSNWTKTDDARNGVNRPQSMVSKLLGREDESGNDKITFDSAEAYEEMRKNLLGRR